MAELNRYERLNQTIDALLTSQTPRPDSDLLAIAAEMLQAPRQSFRALLKSRIRRSARKSLSIAGVEMQTVPSKEFAVTPEGFRSITPYLIVENASRLIEFLTDAFGAEEIARYADEEGKVRHARLRIGDSMLELADSIPDYPPMRAGLHLFVPNVDEVFAKAIEAGATPEDPIANQPYDDREGGLIDPSGNHWYIATHLGQDHVRPPLANLTSYLHPIGAPGYIEFLKGAFDAEVVEHYLHESGIVMHAKLRIGNSMIELGESHGKYVPRSTSFHLYVRDVDATFSQVLEAGATAIAAPEDKPYGERAADVRDPMGNRWFIAQLL